MSSIKTGITATAIATKISPKPSLSTLANVMRNQKVRKLKQESYLTGVSGGVPDRVVHEGLIFWDDEYRVIQHMAEELIRDKYPNLQPVKISYLWRSKPETVGDSYVRVAIVRKFQNRVRDILDKDCYIEICASSWLNLKTKERMRLVASCLRRISPYVTEHGLPMYDTLNRLRFEINTHTLIVETDEEEIREYGMNKEVRKLLDTLKEEGYPVVLSLTKEEKT